jgi:hypothetical protein
MLDGIRDKRTSDGSQRFRMPATSSDGASWIPGSSKGMLEPDPRFTPPRCKIASFQSSMLVWPISSRMDRSWIWIELDQSSGHTPGQMGLRVDYPNGRAIFCADVLHSPVQILDPSISTISFAEPTVANATRRTVLEEASETNRLVVPAHFRGPRCTYVRYTSKKFEPVMTGGIRRASS